MKWGNLIVAGVVVTILAMGIYQSANSVQYRVTDYKQVFPDVTEKYDEGGGINTNIPQYLYPKYVDVNRYAVSTSKIKGHSTGTFSVRYVKFDCPIEPGNYPKKVDIYTDIPLSDFGFLLQPKWRQDGTDVVLWKMHILPVGGYIWLPYGWLHYDPSDGFVMKYWPYAPMYYKPVAWKPWIKDIYFEMQSTGFIGFPEKGFYCLVYVGNYTELDVWNFDMVGHPEYCRFESDLIAVGIESNSLSLNSLDISEMSPYILLAVGVLMLYFVMKKNKYL